MSIDRQKLLSKAAKHQIWELRSFSNTCSILLQREREASVCKPSQGAGRLAGRDRGSTRPARSNRGRNNMTEIVVQMLEADPKEPTSIINVQKATKKKLTSATRKDVKELTETYTSNTSLVATLIATITFAAAFTLPGGYSSDTGTAALPIMASNFAFQAFLISDTLAMCSSIIVAFICILARWEDFEFLLYYISITKKLMWFAYMATVTAFATGLYTVLAPHLPWLAIAICLLPVILPILTKVLGEWSSLKLRVRLLKLRIQFGLTSNSAKPVNLDMVV